MVKFMEKVIALDFKLGDVYLYRLTDPIPIWVSKQRRRRLYCRRSTMESGDRNSRESRPLQSFCHVAGI